MSSGGSPGGIGVFPGQAVLGLRLDSCQWKCRGWENKVFLGCGAPSQFLQWGRELPLVSCRQGHGGHSKEQKELNLGKECLLEGLAWAPRAAWKSAAKVRGSSFQSLLLRLIKQLHLSCSSLRFELLTERGGTNTFPGRPPLWIVG